MEAGIFIFDISNQNNVRLVSTLQPDIHFPRPRPNKIQHPNARGLAIRENLLFIANDAGGIRVIDVSDRRNPKEIGKYINRYMGRKQQAYNNLVINWPYAYVAVDYCGLEILNINNTRNIQPVGWWNPWNCRARSNTWFNSPGHTNQLAFDSRQNLVLLSAGDSELRGVDVSNPRRPVQRVTFGGLKDNLGTWGVTLSNRTIYLSYIKTFLPFRGRWSGIKALNLSPRLQ